MSYTLYFENLNEQDIIDYEKSNNINLRDFIENLIKSKAKMKKETDVSDIHALAGKYQHFAKGKSISIEEMDRIAREEFAKRWAESDRLNRSDSNESD